MIIERRTKPRRIKMTLDKQVNGSPEDRMKLEGWYDGPYSYLWFGNPDDRCTGTLSGRKLYRLAKTIVKHFERGKE